jgi:hypothetical protein
MADFTFIPGESFNGAVARWADEVGGVERMIDLTRAAGVRYGHRQNAATADERGIRELAAEMKVDPDELLRRATPYAPGDWTNNLHLLSFAGVTLPTLLIEKRVRRFAPSGLALSAHHRALWDVRLLPACTVTGEVLLDGCGGPGCGPTTWQATLGIGRCEHCMTDLTGAATTSIPEETRAVLAEFAGLLDHDASVRAASLATLPPLVAALGPSDLIDLLVRIVPVVDRTMPIKLAGIIDTPALQLCNAIAAAWRIVSRWPDAMNDLAASRVAGRSGRHNDGNGGRTMRLLTRKRQVGASKALLSFLAEWRASLSVDKDAGAALRDRSVGSATAILMTGLEGTELVELRQRGLLQVHFALDWERPEARFDKTEIQKVAAALADRCSTAEARNTLGMSTNGIEQLTAMRLLGTVDHPVVDARYGDRQVSRSALAALVGAAGATAGPSPSKTAMTLRSAMKSVGGRLKPWGPVFAMLLSGELPFQLLPGDFALTDRVLVDSSTVELLQSVHLPDRVAVALSPFISKEEAGEILNLNPRNTTALLASFRSGVGANFRTVPLEAVVRLARRHVASVEVAARLRVGPLRAHADAIAAGVPLLGPGGFCRKGLEDRWFDMIAGR